MEVNPNGTKLPVILGIDQGNIYCANLGKITKSAGNFTA